MQYKRPIIITMPFTSEKKYLTAKNEFIPTFEKNFIVLLSKRHTEKFFLLPQFELLLKMF